MKFIKKLFSRDKYISKIVKLAFPVMLGQVMFAVLNFADRFFIGKLGINEAAGSSLSGALIWTLITFTSLITGGTIALVSRKIGEANYKDAVESAEQSLLLSIVLGCIVAAACFLFSGELIGFYQAEPVVEAIGISYFKILMTGFPFMMFGSVAGAIFQSSGNTKTPMFVFSGMSLINLVLDPVLIFGSGPIPSLGVNGAAMATVFSEIAAFVWIYYKLYHYKTIKLQKLFFIRPQLNMMKRILKIGIWSGMNSFSRPLSGVFLQKIIVFHGTAYLAAFSFAMQWVSLIFIFLEGMRIAISTLAGLNLGKKDYESVKNIVNAGLKFGYIIMTIILLVFLPSVRIAIGIFSMNPEVINAGAGFLIIILTGMYFAVPLAIYTAAFNGAGDTMPPMITSFIANWAGKIGTAYIATYYLGLSIDYVWWGVTVSLAIEGIGVTLWFSRGKWKEKIV
ncbi:MAG: MATE family efflux transporter [Thermodesulfobacteriota bacterium]